MDIKIKWSDKVLKNPDVAIEKMAESWQEAYKRTQIALVATVFDLYHGGDQNAALARANLILEKASTGANVKGIVEWFTQMGFANDGQAFVKAPLKADLKELVGPAFQTAKDLNWWKLKPQQAFSGWVLVDEVEKLIEKAKKMAEETDDKKVDKIDVDMDLLAALQKSLTQPTIQ